jgi:hypothetical protein
MYASPRASASRHRQASAQSAEGAHSSVRQWLCGLLSDCTLTSHWQVTPTGSQEAVEAIIALPSISRPQAPGEVAPKASHDLER